MLNQFKLFTTLLEKASFSIPVVITVICITMMGAGKLSAQQALPLHQATDAEDEGIDPWLTQLAKGLNPTIYIENGELKVFGEASPLVVILQGSEVSSLYEANPQFSSVELIKIVLENPGTGQPSVDLNRLPDLKNLRYILVEFHYNPCGNQTDECLPSLVGGMVVSGPQEVAIFYNLSIPE